jgi:EAL domain-containing protein (putative c-di-GMP-specific phosphodiesterase class I)
MKERLLLNAIVEPGGLRPVFQPIFEFSDVFFSIHSFEGLIRGPVGTHLESPDILFEYVRKKGEEKMVDRACLKALFEGSTAIPRGVNLSVNVHASTLGKDDDFPAFLSEMAQANSIDMKNLIVEINEYAPIWDGPRFASSINEVRNSGAKIALDDIGLGHSNYRMILDCLPDYLKIDRYIIQGVHADPFRQGLIESILFLAQRFNARVVAEGVEVKEDLEALLGIGIDLVQGYLLSLPLTSDDLDQIDFSSADSIGGNLSESIDWAYSWLCGR